MTAKNCVWHGPKFLSCVSVLEEHYSGDHSLKHFFQEILDVQDSTIDTVLKELEVLSDTVPSNDNDDILCRTYQAYAYLDAHSESNKSLTQIR